MRRLSIILSLLLIQGVVSAQDKVVTGRVVNERGDGIEYVSIGIPKDTVFTVSDTQGYFRLLIPDGKTEDVVFKHVSYETFSISPEYCYSVADGMIVTLVDNALPEAVVFPDAGKTVTVLGKGVRWAGASFGLCNDWGGLKDDEWGSLEKIRKPTRIDRAEIIPPAGPEWTPTRKRQNRRISLTLSPPLMMMDTGTVTNAGTMTLIATKDTGTVG